MITINLYHIDAWFAGNYTIPHTDNWYENLCIKLGVNPNRFYFVIQSIDN